MSDSSETNCPWQWTMITSLVHSSSRMRQGVAGLSGIKVLSIRTSNGGEGFERVSHMPVVWKGKILRWDTGAADFGRCMRKRRRDAAGKDRGGEADFSTPQLTMR